MPGEDHLVSPGPSSVRSPRKHPAPFPLLTRLLLSGASDDSLSPPPLPRQQKAVARASTSKKFTVASPSTTAPRRPTAAKVVDWTKDPSRERRLFDWLDAHPREQKKLLLDPPARGNLSRVDRVMGNCKMLYGRTIVAAVFHADPDPVIRALARDDPERLAQSILRRVQYLRGRYRHFVEAIGPKIANLSTEQINNMDFDEDNLIWCEMRAFPLWKRLHGYWRKLPQLNRFYYSSSTGVEKSQGKASESGKSKSSIRRSAYKPIVLELTDSSDDEMNSQELQSSEVHSRSAMPKDVAYKIERQKTQSAPMSYSSPQRLPDWDFSLEPSPPPIKNKIEDSQRPLKRKRVESEEGEANSSLKLSPDIQEQQLAYKVKIEELRLKRAQIESANKERERTADLRCLEIKERLQLELVKERKGKRELIAQMMKLISRLEDEATPGVNQPP